MINQGDKIRITIDRLNNEGEGVARTGDTGLVLFVPDALPGEDVTVRVVRVKKNYGTTKVLERHSSSPDRIAPRCPSFNICGGCQLQHINYDTQLKLKKQSVIDALSRIAGMPEPPVEDCLASPMQWGYRNKASLPVQKNINTNFTAGFYKSRTHQTVPFSTCPVLLPTVNKNLSILCRKLLNMGMCGYDEFSPDNITNFIRHIVMRSAQNTGENLCGVVGTRYPKKSELEKIISLQKIKALNLNGMVFNKNSSEGNFIWGDEFKSLYGTPVINEKLCAYDFTFEISSFFQVNTAQAENLYKYAARCAAEISPKNILELYSGIGSLSVFLAACAEKVTAVESWEPAAKYIPLNAERNGMSNIEGNTARAEDIVDSLTDKKYDCLVMDPPRTGCLPEVIKAALKILPERIVYVSCNPSTLARDLKILCSDKYSLLSAKPFDMFPQTGHVETVVLMSRVNK